MGSAGGVLDLWLFPRDSTEWCGFGHQHTCLLYDRYIYLCISICKTLGKSAEGRDKCRMIEKIEVT